MPSILFYCTQLSTIRLHQEKEPSTLQSKAPAGTSASSQAGLTRGRGPNGAPGPAHRQAAPQTHGGECRCPPDRLPLTGNHNRLITRQCLQGCQSRNYLIASSLFDILRYDVCNHFPVSFKTDSGLFRAKNRLLRTRHNQRFLKNILYFIF